MRDLKEVSGLDFQIVGSKLVYDKESFSEAVDWAKSFDDGKYAYTNQNSNLTTLYYGARYFEKTQDLKNIIENDFMADITILESGKVGNEFVKTVGHYHSRIPGLTIAYPEIYEVISGKIEYLLQNEPDKEGGVDVLWVIAEPGDKILMIPNYGHVSMNVGDEIAIELDIQKRDLPNTSDYTVFKENVGGAFYRTGNGLESNPKYKIKSLRIVRPLEKPDWGLSRNVPLYTAMANTPEKFDYLKNPQNFEFKIDELFEDIEL